jgi:hypothetical protein
MTRRPQLWSTIRLACLHPDFVPIVCPILIEPYKVRLYLRYRPPRMPLYEPMHWEWPNVSDAMTSSRFASWANFRSKWDYCSFFSRVRWLLIWCNFRYKHILVIPSSRLDFSIIFLIFPNILDSLDCYMYIEKFLKIYEVGQFAGPWRHVLLQKSWRWSLLIVCHVSSVVWHINVL